MDSLFEGMSNDMAGGLLAGGILGIGAGVIAMIVVVWYVLQVIADWRIFSKFGEPGWKALIPIYNTYVQYKAIWNVKIFWLNLLLAVLVGVSRIGNNDVVNLILSVLSWISLIGLLILEIMQDYYLSRAFGHSIGFAMGLFFLDPIFKMVLGYGNSVYVGNPTTGSGVE